MRPMLSSESCTYSQKDTDGADLFLDQKELQPQNHYFSNKTDSFLSDAISSPKSLALVICSPRVTAKVVLCFLQYAILLPKSLAHVVCSPHVTAQVVLSFLQNATSMLKSFALMLSSPRVISQAQLSSLQRHFLAF